MRQLTPVPSEIEAQNNAGEELDANNANPSSVPMPSSPGIVPPPNSMAPEEPPAIQSQNAMRSPTAAPADPFERMAQAFTDSLNQFTIAASRTLQRTESVAQINPTVRRGPSARSPDKFDGSRASLLRPWLTQLTLVFLNHPEEYSTDKSNVLFAGAFLSGVASDWFQPIIEEGSISPDKQILNDWNLVKCRLEWGPTPGGGEKVTDFRNENRYNVAANYTV